MSYATAPDGTQIYYETQGSGDPLLLVSGQANDHHLWDYIRDDLAARFQIILYDHRGTGRSDKPQEPPYTTRDFAIDAVAVLDHARVSRAHAFGISMGGRICQWLGVDHSARIASLVLGCTTPGNAHGVPRPADADGVLAQGDPLQLLPLLASGRWLAQHREFLARSAAATAQHPVPPYAQKFHYLASEAHDAWALLPQIAAPTLVIHGSQDRINVPANAPLLAGCIPGAELHIIQGARHAFFWEFREETLRVVVDFLERHAMGK